ncbi:hypothetical protein G7Y89_g14582 [Cudoniella acicularis]|uniref:Uncharacterized protein n=1 Tax=Cudoniella acicularis TaxID=354080 RepID=A0A8H4R0N5_9HELO|nr:hypothetical protein G7Y89_g14582 [Cudoniella acicularis]
MTSLLSLPIQHFPDPNNITLNQFQVPNKTSDGLNGAIEETIATILGIIITDAIARTSYWDPAPYLQTKVNGTSSTIVPLEDFLGLRDTFSVNTTLINNDSFALTYDVDRYGYAYGLISSASIAALSCLLFYSALVVIHVVCMISLALLGRYHRATVWGDVHGLIALAMNSAPTDKLYGTSAGVDDRAIWALTVRAREVGDEHLELVFHDDNRFEGAAIDVGKKYC